jgi:glyoxylase-like metal-dependent hydrolase (beta-lactamase superfamily II)
MTSTLPAYVEPLGHGVYAVDTGFQRVRFDAAYLIVERGRAAFVDTGTAFGVPRLLAALDALGIARDAVDCVIPTHVHLDHAGGAGTLMRELPAATLWVHPRGARHLIDPAALWAGATAVYGAEQMARAYGEVVAVPAGRVRETGDGLTIELAGRPLRFVDTPGHARHHHCIWDEASRGWFTGDTFGLSYREFDVDGRAWVLPTSTPVQFEPEALERSVERLLAADPDCVYLTHYGRVGDVECLGAQGLALLRAMVALGRRLRDAPQRHAVLCAALEALYLDSARAHGCKFTPDEVRALLAIDIELNAQGMAVWLDRERRAAQA